MRNYSSFSSERTKMTSLTKTSDGASGGVSKLTLNESGSPNNSRLSENNSKSGSGGEGGPVSPRTLDVIDEDRTSGDETSPSSSSSQQQQHRSKRANMVKKALTYFSDKSNRSVSEDNLFTRYNQTLYHSVLRKGALNRGINKQQ